MRQGERPSIRTIIAMGTLAAAIGFASPATAAKTIIDEWSSVKAPPAPKLKAVTIDPKTTALLMLDFLNANCNAKRRPRCLASLPKVKKLLSEARASKTLVIYSTFPPNKAADIRKEVAPIGEEPVIISFADKFLGTDLEKILKDKGITTVITVGVAAHGAVLYTASEASLRGFHVIVPVDGTSAENTYAEQYTAWNMANAPVVASKVTLTEIDMVKF